VAVSFDSIPHDKLQACLRMRIADRSVLNLIRQWLEAAVVEPPEESGGPPRIRRQEQGTPQGGVISPLLANLYRHWFDKVFHRASGPAHWAKAKLVRYADDGAPRRRGEETVMQERTTQSSLAAQDMRDGPSDSNCRVGVQTTGSGAGPMAGVVSVSEKARQTRQVRVGKTNVSEPLMKCRKRRDVIETGLLLLVRDKARKAPAY
jgi:Reverse transcriptase (RNA-dependent DNA polymerase)